MESRDGLNMADPWGIKGDEILAKIEEKELEALERIEKGLKKRKAVLEARAMERAVEEEELDLDDPEEDAVPGSEADIKAKMAKLHELIRNGGMPS